MDHFAQALRLAGVQGDTAEEVLGSVRPGGAAPPRKPAAGAAGPSRPAPGPGSTALSRARAEMNAPRKSASFSGRPITDDEGPAQVHPSWQQGPSNEQGSLCQLSERPLLCGCTDWSAGETIIGGSDHGASPSPSCCYPSLRV